jgi:hypothetical protein
MARAPSRPARSSPQASREKFRLPKLSLDASAELRLKLMSELNVLADQEALAAWAHKILARKNQLTTADAEALEDLFVARLNQIEGVSDAQPPDGSEAAGRSDVATQAVPGTDAVIMISKPVRERDSGHLRFVASQPCLVCGRVPSDAHHIKFAESWTVGRKVSDKFTVPVCRLHHRDLHRRGNERAWWQTKGIDPLPVAAALWAVTHDVDPVHGEVSTVVNAPGASNGRSRLNGAQVPRGQNNETKPICRPEAE